MGSQRVGLLTWNLFHGRDFPPERGLLTWRSRLFRSTERGERYAQVNRSLLAEFTTLLDGWEWDVALLQEVPPHWLVPLVRGTHSSGVSGLTSRNRLAFARTWMARVNPDLIASGGGGANVVLVRSPGRIEAVARAELARTPERRAIVMSKIALPGGVGLTAACTHLSVPATGQGGDELERAARLASDFAAGQPLVLGGDLNLRPADAPQPFADVRRDHGLAHPTAPRSLDHLLVAGAEPTRPPTTLADSEREPVEPDGLRLRLSDHAPVRAQIAIG